MYEAAVEGTRNDPREQAHFDEYLSFSLIWAPCVGADWRAIGRYISYVQYHPRHGLFDPWAKPGFRSAIDNLKVLQELSPYFELGQAFARYFSEAEILPRHSGEIWSKPQSLAEVVSRARGLELNLSFGDAFYAKPFSADGMIERDDAFWPIYRGARDQLLAHKAEETPSRHVAGVTPRRTTASVDRRTYEQARKYVVSKVNSAVNALKDRLSDREQADIQYVGDSDALVCIWPDVLHWAPTDNAVMIRGESGTGKTALARIIHYASERREKSFVRHTASGTSDELLESELFGHERGAFTGATAQRIGLFESAKGGTVFLDEIGDYGLRLQTRLLDVVEGRTFRRLGGNEEVFSNTRIICATNKDLEELVQKYKHGDREGFREDLYFRLRAFLIQVPPLRDRKEDIPKLIECLAERECRNLKKPPWHPSSAALLLLRGYDWPGNIRDLDNIVKIGVASGEDRMLEELKRAIEKSKQRCSSTRSIAGGTPRGNAKARTTDSSRLSPAPEQEDWAEYDSKAFGKEMYRRVKKEGVLEKAWASLPAEQKNQPPGRVCRALVLSIIERERNRWWEARQGRHLDNKKYDYPLANLAARKIVQEFVRKKLAAEGPRQNPSENH
jgi:DNA-binding NtrC family response regulator